MDCKLKQWTQHRIPHPFIALTNYESSVFMPVLPCAVQTIGNKACCSRVHQANSGRQVDGGAQLGDKECGIVSVNVPNCRV